MNNKKIKNKKRKENEDCTKEELIKEEQFLWNHFSIPAINLTDDDIRYKIEDYEFVLKPCEILNPENDLDSLMKLNDDIGDMQFSSQYLQKPIENSETLLKKNQVSFFSIFDIKSYLLCGEYQIVQSWDTASSYSERSNFNACTTWVIINSTYYLIHILKIKAEYRDLKNIFISHYKKFSSPQYFHDLFEKLENIIKNTK
jgi:hypothetical protein